MCGQSVETLQELTVIANNNSVNITYNKSGYTLDCSNISGKNVLVLQSNPRGMQYSSNSNLSLFSTSTAVFDFTLFKNVNNETISAGFVYPYTKHVILIGFGAILIAIIIMILFTRKRHWFKWLENLTYYGNIVLVGMIVIVFYIIPTFLFWIKIISLI